MDRSEELLKHIDSRVLEESTIEIILDHYGLATHDNLESHFNKRI